MYSWYLRLVLLCSNRRHHARTLQSVQKVCPRFSSAIHLTENTHARACAPFLTRYYAKAFSLRCCCCCCCCSVKFVVFVRFLKSFSLLCPFVSLVFWSEFLGTPFPFFFTFFQISAQKATLKNDTREKRHTKTPLWDSTLFLF